MANIEVERRALLSDEQRSDMLKFMATIGEVKEIKRIMVDFSGHNRQRTVMLRSNNGQLELVAKSGKLTDTIRHEACLQLAAATGLEEALSYLAVMGYERAEVFIRHMYVASDGELEYSVRDVFDPANGKRTSTLFDLEALSVSNESDAKTADEKLLAAFRQHGLEPLTPELWEAWVQESHDKYSLAFSYSADSVQKLAQTLFAKSDI